MSGNPPLRFLELTHRDEGSWDRGPTVTEQGGSLSRSGQALSGVEL